MGIESKELFFSPKEDTQMAEHTWKDTQYH